MVRILNADHNPLIHRANQVVQKIRDHEIFLHSAILITDSPGSVALCSGVEFINVFFPSPVEDAINLWTEFSLSD